MSEPRNIVKVLVMEKADQDEPDFIITIAGTFNYPSFVAALISEILESARYKSVKVIGY